MIRELSEVTLSRELTYGGLLLPKGAKGTVVHVYPESRAYEVEFPTFDLPFTIEDFYLEERE